MIMQLHFYEYIYLSETHRMWELAEFLGIIHITFILFMREWRPSEIAKCYY